MTPELWQRVEPLYRAALEVPAGERAGFLSRECGSDIRLLAELTALLTVTREQAEAAAPGETIDIPIPAPVEIPPPRQRRLADGELLLGRFRIVRRLGAGGMGDVYEAIDLELGQIALKTIRPEVADDPHILAQFRKEAQYARKVSGSHVCRIHELFVVPADENRSAITFLTMEFLEGITLADRIRDSGALPWKEARALALQICSGLQAIHEAGIVHRDLKSRNIMLASRNGVPCAVVMDFGLASALSTSTSVTSTNIAAVSTIAGTPDYMAPEQFEGRELGPPTDIYALGIVLYELVTGTHPFSANTPIGAAVSRGKRPQAPSSMRAGLPRHCNDIIRRCLEFDPGDRYQSAQVLAADLDGRLLSPARLRKNWVKALAVAAALILILSGLLLVPAIGERIRGILFSTREKHIAVLPFDVAQNNPETEAIGDGLMDSLTGKLSNLDEANQSLWVVPASEVRHRKVKDPSSALREFGATLVVEGSFERNNQAARLKLTLVDPKKLREIGFVDVASQDGNLAALQDEAVTRLGRLMNVSLKAGPEPRGTAPVPGAAYEDYLAGLGYYQRFDKPGNLDRAIAALQNSVNTDPRFALGFARLAQAYIMKFRLDPNPQWLEYAEKYCRQAAGLDDRVPSTYVALAQVHELTGKYDLAIQEFQRAISLNPRDAEALTGIASSYENEGRSKEAEAAYLRAASLRPDDWTGYSALGVFYDNSGRPRQAIAQYRHALELTPDNSGLYTNLGNAYMDLDDPGMLDEAEKALKKSIAINPTFVAYGNLGFLYLNEHRFEESIAASQKAIQLNQQSYDLWTNLAAAYEWAQEKEKADAARTKTIQLLQKAVELNPQNAAAQATLAAMRASIGLREQALDGIRISLALSPDSQYVLSQVADAYELLGDRTNAIKYLEQAIAHGLPRQQLRGDPEIQGLLSDRRLRISGR
jgi:serine/threonine protein kinase/tetratricopeptide (TPR) repeat protein